MLMKKPVKCSSCNKKIQATAQICQFCKSTRTPQYVPDPHINNQISFILRLIQSETSFEAVAIKLNDSGNERIDNRSWTAKDIRDIYEDFVGQFNFKNGKWRPCPLCSEEIAMRVTFCKFCKSRVPKIYTKDPFANKQVTKILEFSKSLNDVQIAERLNTEGELRLDDREWLPSDINDIRNEFSDFRPEVNRSSPTASLSKIEKTTLLSFTALALGAFIFMFLDVIFNAFNFEQLEIGDFSPQQVCKAVISSVMGRSPSIISINRTEGTIIYLSYYADSAKWNYRCKLQGSYAIWAAEPGRWRIEENIHYTANGSKLTISQHFPDGSSSIESYFLNQI